MNERNRSETIVHDVRRLVVRLACKPFVGIGLVAIGAVAAVLAMRRMGVDAQWPYLYAYGVRGGHLIFSPEGREINLPILFGGGSQFGMFWPGAMGVVLLPLAALSFEQARVLLLLICVAAVVGGIWALFGLARPRTPWPARLTVAGLVLMSACAIWCFTPVQLTPLLAALVATLVGLHRERSWMVFLATTAVIAIKPTVGLTFVLLLMIGKRGPGLLNVTFPLPTTLAFGGSLAMVLGSRGSLADWKARATGSRERLAERAARRRPTPAETATESA